MTDELEAKACEWLARVEECGGAVAAIEAGVVQNAIAENAYRIELARAAGDEIVVGVNKFAEGEPTPVPLHRLDQQAVDRQIARVAEYKARQDQDRVEAALDAVAATARGPENLLPPMKAALLAGATLGQIVDALRGVFGEHRTG